MHSLPRNRDAVRHIFELVVQHTAHGEHFASCTAAHLLAFCQHSSHPTRPQARLGAHRSPAIAAATLAAMGPAPSPSSAACCLAAAARARPTLQPCWALPSSLGVAGRQSPRQQVSSGRPLRPAPRRLVLLLRAAAAGQQQMQVAAVALLGVPQGVLPPGRADGLFTMTVTCGGLTAR